MLEESVTENLTTKAVQLIDFHGMTIVVVEHNGIDYIAVKPLVDLIGTDWKSARRALFNGDNPDLFGTKELFKPVFDELRGDITPQIGENSDPRVTKKAVYIRLDRSRMYLARVDTSKMRAHGNVKAADALLKLQIEWAEALHSYETSGVAVKIQPRDKDLFSLLHKLDQVKNTELRRIYADQLNQKFGINIPIGKQGTLPV